MTPRLEAHRPSPSALLDTISSININEENCSSWSPLPQCAVSNHEHAQRLSPAVVDQRGPVEDDDGDDIWDTIPCRLTVSRVGSDDSRNDEETIFYFGQDKPKKHCKRRSALSQMSPKSIKESFGRSTTTSSQRRNPSISKKEEKKINRARKLLLLDTTTSMV